MEQIVELPKKYEVIMLNEKLVVIDLETEDFCKITLNPLKIERVSLRNKRIAQKIVRALSTFQAYKTPSIESFL
jgi:hypothetical protein